MVCSLPVCICCTSGGGKRSYGILGGGHEATFDVPAIIYSQLHVIGNGNWIEWSTIQGVIGRVISNQCTIYVTFFFFTYTQNIANIFYPSCKQWRNNCEKNPIQCR